MNLYFNQQVELLLDVLGTVAENPFFVLKGGTAINFFHANMPRLSVDIDLAYRKINLREEFLRDNKLFWDYLCKELPSRHGVKVQMRLGGDGTPWQMYIKSSITEIKVETNLVLRGTIYPTVIVESCKEIQKKYMKEIELETLSIEELYAGKFCAALDRQHPRDLFDVWVYFENYQFSERFKKAFLVYLISANRPIAELLDPNRLDQQELYEKEFLDMTSYHVSYETLVASREKLIDVIGQNLTQDDRNFLISFKKGEPNWSLLGLERVQDLPAIKWKLRNIVRMDPKKHEAALDNLKKKLVF